ncbi:MAG: transposase [Terriglobia bacterium]
MADSLPQAALHAFEAERDSIHRRAKQQGRELTASEGIRLEELYSEHVEGYLDSGAGACYLARPEIAELVAGALLHFNGKRYRLEAWCVMPNHVHVVFTVSRGESLKKILHSWKSYTAHKACEILGLSGEFWQREYYDHLVRNEQELARLVRYTESNPAKAHLSDWRWCSAAAPR